MIDTHAHLYLPELSSQLEVVMQRFTDAGGLFVVNCAIDAESCGQVIKQSQEYPEIVPALSLHPELIVPGTDIYTAGIDGKWIDTQMEMLERLLDEHPNIVAIGECGLDYYWMKKERLEGRRSVLDLQRELFSRHISLALERDLPLVIHCRDEPGDKQAVSDTLDLLVNVGGSKVHGVFHSYTESVDFVEDIIGLGMYIGVNGIVTYKNADNVREVLDAVPTESLLLETDAPWLSPNRHRSAGAKVCEPAFVDEVAEFVAKRKGLTKDRVWKIVEKSAKNLFGV